MVYGGESRAYSLTPILQCILLYYDIILHTCWFQCCHNITTQGKLLFFFLCMHLPLICTPNLEFGVQSLKCHSNFCALFVGEMKQVSTFQLLSPSGHIQDVRQFFDRFDGDFIWKSLAFCTLVVEMVEYGVTFLVLHDVIVLITLLHQSVSLQTYRSLCFVQKKGGEGVTR